MVTAAALLGDTEAVADFMKLMFRGSQLQKLQTEVWSEFVFSQVFEEEHHILYLDHGGVIVAIKDTSIPLKILKYVLFSSSLLLHFGA